MPHSARRRDRGWGAHVTRSAGREPVGAGGRPAPRPLCRHARTRVILLVPFVDRVSAWVDQRVMTTSFAAEETLTSDTVPVNVDAVLFWMAHDPEKAALRSRTTLRP